MLNDESLWRNLYRSHIDPEPEVKISTPWKERFKQRWQIPNFDNLHKHPEIILSNNNYSCELGNCSATDRGVRLARGYGASQLGVFNYIEFQVTRGRYHTLLGVCDDKTAEFKEHHRPWNPAGSPGIACCYASDGVYYGSSFLNSQETSGAMERWETGDRVGVGLCIEEAENGLISLFRVQFFRNGTQTGGTLRFRMLEKLKGSLFIVACLYGAGEKLEIIGRRSPHQKEPLELGHWVTHNETPPKMHKNLVKKISERFKALAKR